MGMNDDRPFRGGDFRELSRKSERRCPVGQEVKFLAAGRQRGAPRLPRASSGKAVTMRKPSCRPSAASEAMKLPP